MSAFDRSELDGYEALVFELRANPPVAPERLRQRVLASAPAARVPRSRKRKLVLAFVVAGIVVAVGPALVHGFVTSGSHGNPTTAASLVQNARSPHTLGPLTRSNSNTPHAATAHAQSWKAASEGSFGKDTAASGANVYAAAKATARRSLVIPKHRLVHAVASLQVGVKSKDLSAKTNQASQIVASYGGYAQSVRYQASHRGYGEAFLTLKVPVQNAQAAIGRLGGLGTLLSQQVSTQDLQAKVTRQGNAIGSLRRAITVYENALNSGTLSASERVTIQIRLNNARRALSRLRHARNATQALGATADISLLLTTRSHAIVVPHHHGSTRLGRFLGSAAHFLALEGIIVLYALIVLAPVLLLGALAWWIVRERRRREERLLASA
jgi:hypothetical protein